MKKSQPKRTCNYRDQCRQIYETHFEDLYAYAMVITSSSPMADDAISEVFFDLLRTERDLDMVRDIRAYLFSSVRNRCIKLLSKDPLKFDALQKDVEFQLIEKTNPEELLLGKELEEFLEERIALLPSQCQLVFRLVRNQRRSYKQVASQLGISPNTVRNHLVAAVKHLRHELEAHYKEAPVMKLLPAI